MTNGIGLCWPRRGLENVSADPPGTRRSVGSMMAPSGSKHMSLARILLALSLTSVACAQNEYDLLIKGGHVIDGKNHLSAVRDVAIKDNKIAAVAADIAASRASRTLDAAGLYVTPGLVDIHVHVFPGL